MALVTILCPTILSRAFGVRRDADSSSGSCLIIKTLVEGSIDDIKKVVLSPGFALAVTQMQHLDLSREVRRSRNRQLIFCLGNSQSEAFATLKNMMNVETARQIIQDFEHSNTKMNRLADIIEDLKTPLKKMCDEAKCFVTCGVYNWKQTFTCCAETTQLASVGILPYLAEFVVAHIGAFEEEQNAFDLMSRLIWQLPLFIVLTAILDLLLVLVYMKWLHPWKAILEDVSRSISFNEA